MNVIYSRQFAFVVFLYVLGSAFLNIPESVIGKDVYISTALASLIGLGVLHIIIKLQGSYPKLNIMQIAELALGKIAGKILNLFYIWTLFMLAILILFDIVLFLQLLYPRNPDILLSTIVLLSSTYVVSKGINIIGRLGDIAILPVFVLIILAFGVSISLFDLVNILPVLANIKPILGGTIFAAYWPFTQIIALAILLPFIIDFEKKKKLIYYSYIIASITLIIRSFLVLGVLGENLIKISHFPFYDIFLMLRFQDFQRIELFFFLLFVTLVLTVLIVAHSTLTLALQSFFKLKNYSALVIPLALFILVFTCNIFPSEIEFFASYATTVIFFTLPINILYPLIVYIAAQIKLAKKESLEGIKSES